MKKDLEIFVLLPAFNEALNLLDLFKSFEQLGISKPNYKFSVILVDDGSEDPTRKIAEEYEASYFTKAVLWHPKNLGLANALKTGINFFIETSANESDLLVVMDADNTHKPGQILDLIQVLVDHPSVDICVASRYKHGSTIKGVSSFRRFLSDSASILFRLSVSAPAVKDYSCGYRIYRKPILTKVLLNTDTRYLFNLKSFSCMTEILLVAYRQGAKFEEIPLDLRYDEKRGASKMNILATIKDSIFLIFRHWFLRFTKTN